MSTLFSFLSTEEVKWLSQHSSISSGAYLSAVAVCASQGFQLVSACNTNTLRSSINRLTFTALYLVCCVLIHHHRSLCQSYAEKRSSRQDFNRLRQQVAIPITFRSRSKQILLAERRRLSMSCVSVSVFLF